MRKPKVLAPDSWGTYQRNDFNEPRLFCLPIHRKMLNSLSWYNWISSMSSDLLMLQLPGLCCRNSYTSWLLPYLFRAVAPSYLRCHGLGLSPQYVHQTSSTVVLEKTLESPLDCKIKPVNLKGNQRWIFIERTDAEAEAPILWPPDVISWLIAKDPDAGKDWGQEEKGTTEDEMDGWHHCLNGHEFEQALGDGVGQGSLMCCSLWGPKESDMT